jgi:hypothetical protein
MEFKAGYSLADSHGEEVNGGGAGIELDETSLSIRPKSGEALLFPIREVVEILPEDYRITIRLISLETLVLSELGYQFEDFCRILNKTRNELLLKDMLMEEPLKKSGVEADYAHTAIGGKNTVKGKCELRLYETSLVVLPEKAELARVPYGDILNIKDVDYTLTVDAEPEGVFAFSMMGREYDPFTKKMSECINELSLKTQLLLKEMLPKLDSLTIRKIAALMKEGRAAKKSDINTVSPEIWPMLEKKLEQAGLKEEYSFLKAVSQADRTCIGVKKGLMGGLTGEYLWFLMPVYCDKPKEPGNAIAMESFSEENEGKATYFFKLAGRKKYGGMAIEDLHIEADRALEAINRCMIAINFRREPVYLPEERLEEPAYQKYIYAIQRIPELKTLRESYIGRVIHASPEQWKKDVTELLAFNVSAQDDNVRWEKA